MGIIPKIFSFFAYNEISYLIDFFIIILIYPYINLKSRNTNYAVDTKSNL